MASVRSASTSIGCVAVGGLGARAGSGSSGGEERSGLRATRRIASFDIGEQLDAVGFQVGAQAGAVQYRVRPGVTVTAIIGAGQVLLRAKLQVARCRSAVRSPRGVGRSDRTSTLSHAGALPRPCRRPRRVSERRAASGPPSASGKEKRGLRELRLLPPRIALQVRRRHREGFLALSRRARSVRSSRGCSPSAAAPAPAARGLRLQLPHRDAGQRRRRQQRAAPRSAACAASWRAEPRSSASRWPCALEDQVAQLARRAVAAARARCTQCTRSRTHGCALAGATARPTCANTARSGRSSPM